jgi:hypothetical protein
LRFGWFFSFFKKIVLFGILGPLGNHASRWIRNLWSKGVTIILAYFLMFFEFLHFEWFFPFFPKIGFLGILGPPGNQASPMD